MRYAAALAALTVIVALASPAQAGGGPENVVVVVNAESWASLAVANEFVRLRRIPPDNVIYLDGLLGNFERIGIDEFREKILGPVLETIRRRGLEGQIDYVVYSADLPWGVDVGKDAAGRKLPGFITLTASINGLTYLHQKVMARDIEYLNLGANGYVRRPRKEVRQAAWTEEDRRAMAFAVASIADQKWDGAAPVFERLARAHTETPDLSYNHACCLARLGKPDEAMAALQKAVDAGWADANHTLKDEDLTTLRQRDDFKRLVEKMKQSAFTIPASVGFRAAGGWLPDGRPSTVEGARRYLLSTMLAVTSGRGTSVREAVEGLRRSAAADGAAPKGTIYFMKNGDIRSTTREWAFAATAAELRKMGVASEVIDGVLPKQKADVAGAMIGTAGFDWPSSGSTILPGAICEHLTSCGGIMSQGGGQTPLSEFLRAGAAGASGAVTEPMAIQAKFPTALVHVHYARGCTLAEAFYQSLAGPYQLLIVGDPLCRPWAKAPEVRVDGLAASATVKGTVKLRPDVKKDAGVAIERYELFVDGRRRSEARPGETLELDTRTLPDGWHELRVVAITADAIQTQGRAVLPIAVANQGRVLKVTAPAGATVSLDQRLKLRAAMPGAKQIRFYHNGRELASLRGAEGEVEIDATRLGLGPVRIQAVALLTDPPDKPADAAAPGTPANDVAAAAQCVTAAPVEVTVTSPAPLPARQPPEGTPGGKGLRLVFEDADPLAIDTTRDGSWLAKAGVRKDQPFALEGWVDVPADDVHQFQVSGNVEAQIEVDGRPIGRVVRGKWQFLTVALAAGSHEVRLTGRGDGSLDVRFGGPGAFSLGGERFRYYGPVAGR